MVVQASSDSNKGATIELIAVSWLMVLVPALEMRLWSSGRSCLGWAVKVPRSYVSDPLSHGSTDFVASVTAQL
jgi:hypothetical protein